MNKNYIIELNNMIGKIISTKNIMIARITGL